MKPSWAPIAIALVVSGCHGPKTVICDGYCHCETCTEERYDECVHGNDVLDAQADDRGCSASLEAYLSCVAESMTCSDARFGVDACLVAYQDLASCLGQTPCCPVFDPCGRASYKLVTCGLAPDGPASSSYCDGVTQCAAECINAAPCNEIAEGVNPPEQTAFSTCFAACG
jgi:hypothetical protein